MKTSGIIRVAWVLAALVAMLATASCGGGDGTVKGTVTQVRTAQLPPDNPANVGDPVPNAGVVVYGLERFKDVSQSDIYRKTVVVYRGSSAEDGSFSFDLAPGKYVVEIWIGSFEAGNRQVTVKSGQVTEVSYNVSLP